ncbi:kinesin-associated protein 3 isoform X2 [Thrips palmi]|uniref:Kinesin-associated protein 3 isoform X2 n=1 Tax=Thrips palmi TaxID=161013 RepID=A0A6P8YWV5_THRPL|nr:kinesin-associated protein 3 isoform X2 [Thrips palmi]
MQCDEARFIKRKIRAGAIDVHPTETALVVSYQLEAFILGELGDPMLGDKKECQKIIRLKSLNPDTDCAALAKEVVEKCSLIHSSKIAEVEHLIYYLQNRKENPFNDRVESPLQGSIYSGTESPSSIEMIGNASAERATIANIESYVELLYEDMAEKVRGSGLILELAKDPNNLEDLAKNESLLSALSRVLREDWRKSMELSTNIVYVFFCFSTFSQFHSLVLQYKIGSLCMEIVDFELKRYEQWKADLESCRGQYEPNNGIPRSEDSIKNNIPPSQVAEHRRSGAFGHSHIPVSRRHNDPSPSPSGGDEDSKKKRHSLLAPGEILKRHVEAATSSGDGGKRNSMVKSPSYGMVRSPSTDDGRRSANSMSVSRTMTDSCGSVGSMENEPRKDSGTKQREEFDKTARKFRTLIKKQDQLLRVCIYLLLNIAENQRVEDKMRKKNVVGVLTKTLERTTPELLVLAVTFLKKLSLFKENKDVMAELNIIDKLQRVLQMGNAELDHVTLKLLFNLSFDTRLRERMVRAGYLPKLVGMLSEKQHQSTVLKILYNLSMDDRVKSMFTYTDCVNAVVGMALEHGKDQVDLVVVALAINLALNKRNAEIMVEGGRLQLLMDQAFRNLDSLLMKVVRNISQHDSCKLLFVEFIGDLAKVLTQCTDKEFLLECLGVMANLTLPDLDYSQVLQQFRLIPWLRAHLVPGKSEDDLVLEVVMLLGTVAADENCASVLCKADLLLSLIELLKAKQEDDEMVLQIVFVFYQMARHHLTREYLIKETEAPAYLIDLMHDKNSEIRKLCDACLDVIKECNEDWASRIKLEKFRWHNSQWLEMVESQALDTSGYGQLGDDGDPLPAFLSSDMLTHSLLFPAGSHVSLDDLDDIEIVSNNTLSDGESRPGSRDGALDEFGSPKKNPKVNTNGTFNNMIITTGD